MEERVCNVPIGEILSLVHCSDDYGFYNDVLMCSFASITGYVYDNEILSYAEGFLSEEMKAHGYGEEDRDSAIETCTDWRDKYCEK